MKRNYQQIIPRKGAVIMDALSMTLEGLQRVSALQQAKQKEVKSIRSKDYKKIGLYQLEVTDADKRTMIARVEDDCSKHCSLIYEDMNQERIKAGLPELYNPYKSTERK